MSRELPPLPEGEEDEDGRRVHPYVRDDARDPSAPGYAADNGVEVTAEERSHESRLAFHAIEGLLPMLTPWGMAHLMASLSYRLYGFHRDAPFIEQTVGNADPRNESMPFLDLHRERLAEIERLVEEVMHVCPQCGRNHGPDAHETLQPGPYVNASSGDAVMVQRVELEHVYARAEVSPERFVDRVYERPWFDENFVPAEGVEVLPSP